MSSAAEDPPARNEESGPAPALSVRGLSKAFGEVQALSDIDLEVPQGITFGLLGPNGAGKTTLLSILATLLRQDSGSAAVLGYDCGRRQHQVRSSIGMVFQGPSVDDELTARENLWLHGRLYKMSNEEVADATEKVLKLVELTKRADEPLSNYSGGMRRRLELARGLLHKPRVLFLDEPTLGLDPQTRRRVWDYLRTINREEGVTVLLTTHYLDEAEQLCDRLAIIDHGKVIADGTPAELAARAGGERVSVRLPTLQASDATLPPAVTTAIESLPATTGHRFAPPQLTLDVDDATQAVPALLAALQQAELTHDTLRVRSPTLEDGFIALTGSELRHEEAPSGMQRWRGRMGRYRQMRRGR